MQIANGRVELRATAAGLRTVRVRAALALTGLLTGCFTVTTPSDFAGAGGTGTTQQAPPRCDQTCQDDDVA
jgi:hypothetical protein